MLSFQQFIAKHPVKYKGLTVAQKRQRYADYQRSLGSANNNATQPRRRRRGRQGRRASNRAAPVLPYSAGTAQFIKLYANPFDNDFTGLPVFPCPPSAKYTIWSRGQFYTGTTGVGFVSVAPATVSDIQPIFFTTSAYAGTTISEAAGTGVTAVGYTNVPIASTSLTGEVSGSRARVAICALRIRYTGPEQNKGGVVYPYVHPLHQDLNGKDTNYLASQEYFRTIPVSRDWVTVVWTPVFRTECDFYHTTQPPAHNSVDTNSGANPIAIMVLGISGLQFEYQIIEHLEYTGPSSMWLTKTNTNVGENLTDVIDKLQDPSVAIREGAPRRNFAPKLPENAAGRAGLGFLAGAAYQIMRIRDEL